jgi:hypothetical protein
MDPLQQATLARAKGAIEMLSASVGDTARASAKAFTELAFATLTHESHQIAATHPNEIVRRAAAHVISEGWSTGDAAALAAAFVASIAELSLLDQIAKYARVLPIGQRRALIASGTATATGVVAEGAPKVVRRLALSFGDVEPTKVASIVVLTNELAMAAGGAGQRLFEQELAASISAAANKAVLDLLTDSNTIEVAGTGDPLADLRAGLRAAGPSAGYVVAAPAGDVADLATSVANRGGMGVRGGTFVPGVEIVAMDDLSGMHIITASRLAMFDAGLEIRSAGHADVNMADSPSAPSAVVSLWQTGSVGLIAERGFHLAGDATLVVVGGES